MATKLSTALQLRCMQRCCNAGLCVARCVASPPFKGRNVQRGPVATSVDPRRTAAAARNTVRVPLATSGLGGVRAIAWARSLQRKYIGGGNLSFALHGEE